MESLDAIEVGPFVDLIYGLDVVVEQAHNLLSCSESSSLWKRQQFFGTFGYSLGKPFGAGKQPSAQPMGCTANTTITSHFEKIIGLVWPFQQQMERATASLSPSSTL